MIEEDVQSLPANQKKALRVSYFRTQMEQFERI
jgi:hypothetical protein